MRFNLVIPERIIAIDSARKKGQVGSKVTELTLSDEEEEAMLEEVEKMKMSGVTQGRFLHRDIQVCTPKCIEKYKVLMQTNNYAQ